MKTKLFQFGLVLLGLFCIHQLSYADGVFIPTARKKMPDIPFQRAIVKYREGTEALIVESSLSGKGGDYGWLIPVPSPPRKFEKVSPGLLKTISLQIQPQIHQRIPNPKAFGIDIALTFTFLVVFGCYRVMRKGARAIIFPLLLIFLYIFAFPNFITYKAGPGALTKANPFIKVSKKEIVGDYEIFVLEVKNSIVLINWLKKNGLNILPTEGAKIIDDYISDNWVFTVAKLRTALDGVATPHPILIEFETDKPVYPMRLTSIPGSRLYLELFVVADKEAAPANYSLNKEYCNFFDYKEMRESRFNPLHNQKGFIPRIFFPPEMAIAHPDAPGIMWDGCVVTKFAGSVSSDEMRQDMFWQFKDATPFRPEMYTVSGALDFAYNIMLVIMIFGSISLTIYCRLRKWLGTEVSIARLFILLVMISAAGFGISYAMVGEKTAVHTSEPFWYAEFRPALDGLFSDPNLNFSNGPELIDLLQKHGIVNPVTGEPIILEQSPGNLIFDGEASEDKLKICLENGLLYNLFN